MGGLTGVNTKFSVQQCAWKRCKSTALSQVMVWSTECSEHRREPMCDKHIYRVRGNQRDTYRCEHGIRVYYHHVEPRPEPPATADDGYKLARDRYLDTGQISHKEAMEACVTLTTPQGWDVYGSILAPPAAPRQRKSLIPLAGALIVLFLTTAVFLLGMVTT